MLESILDGGPKVISVDGQCLRVTGDGVSFNMSMAGAERVQRRSLRIAVERSPGRIAFTQFKQFLGECYHDPGEVVWRDGFVDLKQRELVCSGSKDGGPSSPDAEQEFLLGVLGRCQSRFVDMERRSFVLDDKPCRVHYNTYASVSGRLATPVVNGTVNMHSMPREMRCRVKPWRHGRVFVSADLKSAEFVTLARICGCPRMNAVIESGIDPHDFHAKVMFEPRPEEMALAREYAKTVFFVFLYGGSVGAVANAIGIDHNSAVEIMAKFEKLYPSMIEWRAARVREATETMLVRAPHGRVLRIGSAEEAGKMAVNFPIQSVTADVATVAALAFEAPQGCWPIIHHHDAMVVDCEPEMAAEAGERLVESFSPAFNPLIGRLNMSAPYGVLVRTSDSWG